MQKIAILTICSRNYLGQALTLKQSVRKHHPDFSFYLFLADKKEGDNLPEVVPLSDEIVPNWNRMAFKYDVIEFNTSIKPFCIDYLFKQGYDKVMYIDPDIYLFNKLDSVVDNLDTYSIVLTPHRIKMTTETNAFYDDVCFLPNGIFNLGFVALRNNKVGQQIINWWKERLVRYCYLETREGLAVDQKWMDFIPGYFPNDTLISHDPGLNIAVWNINEREISYQDSQPYVNLVGSSEKSTLKFFHFSGYSPEKKTRLDKRFEASDNRDKPTLVPLMEEYCQAEINNGFFEYKKYPYAFNAFDDGTLIQPLNRRLYRINEEAWCKYDDPFKETGMVYQILKSKKLLSKKKISTDKVKNSHETTNSVNNQLQKIHVVMRLLVKVVGVERYQRILRGVFGNLSRFENNDFLLD